MMDISAALVKELRERTKASMMDCKRALVASQGNIEEAIQEMRKAGQSKAEKKTSRITAEGAIGALCSLDTKSGVLLEINCETDFVGREQKFRQFANSALAHALVLGAKPEAFEMLKATMEPARLELVAQLGENISIRRMAFHHTDEGLVGTYLHGGSVEGGARIGVLVLLKQGTAEIARDVAMHIAAMSPEYLQSTDIPADRLEKEREVALAEYEKSAQVAQAHLREPIIAGKLKKFMAGITLLEQAYVRDPSKTVKAFLEASKAEVQHFVRFAVGEGIQKKTDDFVSEVMAQARGDA